MARSGHIDALRGFAILFVMQFHLFSATGAYETLGLPLATRLVLDYGWAGVDLFFVLSAFLLTRNILKTRDQPGAIFRFCLRRAFRILPLYLIILLAGFTLEAILDPQRSTWLWEGRYRLVDYLLFTQNWIHGADGHPGGQFYGPTWSLAAEEHFYLLLPLLALTLSRRGLLGMALVWIAASPLLRHLVETTVNPVAAYTWTITRLDSFGWGMCLALLPSDVGAKLDGRRLTIIVVAGCVAGIVALAMPATEPGVIDGRVAITLIACCAGAVCLACVTARGPAPDSAVIRRAHAALRWAGQRCFSLYLLHMPVLGLVFLCADLSAPRGGAWVEIALILVSLGLTLLLSAATYAAIEAPCLRLADRWKPPPHTTAARHA